MERWLPVVGYEDLYSVSDLGRVRSEDRIIKHPSGSQKKWRGRVLKQSHIDRYPSVSLCREGGVKQIQVHIIVLTAFVSKCPPGQECAHGDGNKLNTHLYNLRWATRSSNHADKVAHGTARRGELATCVKLTKEQAKSAFHDRRGNTQIGRDLGVSRGAIDSIKRRRSWAWLDMSLGG